jgi:hypothetical protein
VKPAYSVLCMALVVTLLVGCEPWGSAGTTPTAPLVSGAGFDTPTAGLSSTETPPPLPSETPAPNPTVTGMPSGTAVPAPSPTSIPTLLSAPPTLVATPSTDLLRQMDSIEAEVERLRGLDETSPITRSLMTRQELEAYTQRQFEEDYPPEEVEADVQVLAAFDFIPQDFDLRGALVDLYSSQVVGFYDDDKKTLFVVTDVAGQGFDLLARMTFAHEYTHGLQDEHFGLDTFVDEHQVNDDALLARLSLVEGDASLSMAEYLYDHLAELTAKDINLLQSAGNEASQQALAAAPAILRETLNFPYIYGLDFVSTLHEQSWEAVDTAYADPPQSTEQILHPEKYLSRDEPQIVTVPPLTATLGAGWHLVEAETLGEFQTGLYLAQQVDQETADQASAGWDGDQYAVYVDDNDTLLVFSTAWDSAQDRQEFVNAYIQYAVGKYDQPPSHQGQSEILWEGTDQAAYLSWKGAFALLILGPDLATVEQVREAIR